MNGSNQNSASQMKGGVSRAKRLVVAFCGVLFALSIIAAGAYFILGNPSAEEEFVLSYEPWADLSNHYDLSNVKMLEDGLSHFNSVEISEGCVPFTSGQSVAGEYDATIIGTGVWVRSYAKLKPKYKLCQVNTGDRISVQRTVGHADGKTWCYAKIKSGRCAGFEGFICTDYVMEQRAYDLLKHYVLDADTNMSLKTPTKYLRSVAALLSKLDVNMQTRRLSVTMLDDEAFDEQSILTLKLHDHNLANNSSLLAFILFSKHNDDFVVLGIVPGNSINSIHLNPNGSYDIYYY